MPAYKNQHYVPKFYFRFFSNDGKNIESYNLKRKQSFTSSIDTICSKNYFYSKNTEVEKSLNPLEDSQRTVMKSVIETQGIPSTPKEYLILLSFICLQHARTKATKIKGDHMMKLLSDEIVEGLLGKKADVELVYPAMHMLIMKTSLQSIPLIGDLIPVILVNKTPKDFIFSDNPVVFHNTYLNSAKGGGVLGLQSPGLQIFCPLNNSTMLMLYDPIFYSINIGRDYKLEINNEGDIQSLNTLQFLNCDESVFYSDKSQENIVKEIHEKIKYLTGKRKTTKRNFSLQDKNGQKREFIHFFEERPDYDLKLSFVKMNPVSNIGMVRNPEMVIKIQKDMDNYDKYQKSKILRRVYNFKMALRKCKYRLLTKF